MVRKLSTKETIMKLNVENNDQKLRLYLELSHQEIKLYRKWMMGIISVSLPIFLSYPGLVRIVNPQKRETLPPQTQQITNLSKEGTKNLVR